MKKEYMNPSFEHQFVEETAMIALSISSEYADKDSEVLVKEQDPSFRANTVEWDDWD